MRSLFLHTTFITCALVSASAFAAGPQVTLGGSARWEAGVQKDDISADSQRPQGFRNDTEIDVKMEGQTDGGAKYGAQVNLEADVTPPARDEGTNANRTLIYYQGHYGRIEAGSTPGAAKLMKVDATRLARATGGIEGDWQYFANTSGLEFITAPELLIEQGDRTVMGGTRTEENANKIGYYSPRFYGMQFGVSYAPDFTDRGQVVTRADGNAGSSDNWELALGYEHMYGDLYLAAAVTGWWGHPEVHIPGFNEDGIAWNAGAVLGWHGWKVGGSYGDWNHSLNSKQWEGKYWTAGGSYEYGPWGASVTYLDSKAGINGANKFSNIVVGTDYKVAPGLTPFAEVSYYKQDAPGSADDNTGTVGILGTQLDF